MSQARWIGVGIAGVACVGAVIAVGLAMRGDRGPGSGPETPETVAVDQPAEIGDLAHGLRTGTAAALTALGQRLALGEESGEAEAGEIPHGPVSAEQLDEYVGWIDALGHGFATYGGPSKIIALTATGEILDRVEVDGVPSTWSDLLEPSFKVVAAGLADREPSVRVAAADLVADLWGWSPGCSMTPAEENDLGLWKEGFHPLVVRRLEDAEPLARAAAVRCLGQLPIDAMAEPALEAIRDADFTVRYQALVSFANRPSLLTEDQILPMLHDPIPDLAGLAERVLKARGLPQELIGLGRLIAHARPDMRSSAIPLLLKREDIDPVVWLLHLTEDADPGVRLQAVEALEGRSTAEVEQRLRQLATSDDSEDVRSAAARLAPATADQTVSLPPLPSIPGMSLRGN